MLDGSEAKVREESVDRGGTGAADLLPAAGRRLVGFLRLTLRLGVLVLLAATFMPLFHPLWPLASVAEHFALQILVGAVLLAVLALGLRHWRWLGLVIAIALLQLWIIHPYWPRFADTQATASANDLKIVSFNAWVRNTDFDSTRRYLAASGADVIGLVEVTPELNLALASLAEIYPYRVDCIGTVPGCQEVLLSKHPIRRSSATRLDGALPVLAWAEILPDGTAPPITIALAHVARPIFTLTADPANFRHLTSDLPALLQGAQTDRLAGALLSLERDLGVAQDLILLGDFNAAPWSRVQQALREKTGLDNAGFLVPSWPSALPAVARLPIDHIMVRGSIDLISLTTGPALGSDHLPIEAVLSLAQP